MEPEFDINTGLKIAGSAVDGLRLGFYLARSFDVFEGGDFFKAFGDWNSQIIMGSIFLPYGNTKEYAGRLFFTLSYTGLDGLGFQTGIDSKLVALILSVNSFIEGYYGTTMGKFSLYFKFGVPFNPYM